MPFDFNEDDGGGGDGGGFNPHDPDLITQLLTAARLQAELNLKNTGACPSCFYGSLAGNAIIEMKNHIQTERGLDQFEAQVMTDLETLRELFMEERRNAH